jgi:hypothetical protein
LGSNIENEVEYPTCNFTALQLGQDQPEQPTYVTRLEDYSTNQGKPARLAELRHGL